MFTGLLRLILIVSVILSLSISIFGFDLSKVIEALEGRDYAFVISAINDLKERDKKTFYSGEYDYLLARVAEKQGDFALASANYLSVVKRDSVLKEYALWHLAKISRAIGDLMIERVLISELLTESPGSLLREAAIKRLVRSYFESRDFGQMENLAFMGFSEAKDLQIDREMQVLLGLSFLRSGKKEQAREMFLKTIEQTQNASQPDDFDLEAVKGLDEIDKDEVLTDSEHLQRGKIYFFNREFRQARAHFSTIVANFPNSTLLAESMFLIGRSFFSEENYHEAIKWFERVLVEFPDSDFASEALLQSASAFSKVNKLREAISRYRRYIDLYPEGEKTERAYLNIVDTFRDMGEEGDALNWIEKTQQKFSGSSVAVLASFAKARVSMAKNDWVEALKILEQLQKDVGLLRGKTFSGQTDEVEVSFLRAYCLEHLGQYKEAIELYFSIPDGRNSYYGWRASERLKSLFQKSEALPFIKRKLTECENLLGQSLKRTNADSIRRVLQNCLKIEVSEENRAKIVDGLKKVYSFIPYYQKAPKLNLLEGKKLLPFFKSYHGAIARKLLSLGIYDEGTPEFEASLREILKTKEKGLSAFPPDFAYTLAVFYTRGEMPRRSISWMESLWGNLPADYEVNLIPRRHLVILYPTAYSDLVLRYSQEKNLDPRFILSIIRQESMFYSGAKSKASARGLMQFISTTANQIAAESGFDSFSLEQLYDPSVSVALGSTYLAKLFKIFPNQPQAVAASYNGGEKNMLRWLVRSKSNEADRYVPEILFVQSKDYVFKVMSNYRMYQMIYNENLKERQ